MKEYYISYAYKIKVGWGYNNTIITLDDYINQDSLIYIQEKLIKDCKYDKISILNFILLTK